MNEFDLKNAAKQLLKEGNEHGWFPQNCDSLEKMDDIGREEFLDLTYRILVAYDPSLRYDEAEMGIAKTIRHNHYNRDKPQRG